MADLKLFRIAEGHATELTSASVALERSLQFVIEDNMQALFGVRLVQSEFLDGLRHGGRMDSIGLDENGSPVIFEYKRAVNENVINHGLYLSRLVDGPSRRLYCARSEEAGSRRRGIDRLAHTVPDLRGEWSHEV